MNRKIQAFVAIIALSALTTIFGGQVPIPSKIILKNGSAFDIMYKPFIAGDIVYHQGTTQEVINENNIIKSGEWVVLPTNNRRPIRLSIKRYGYGSSFSPWVNVTDPYDDSVRNQLGGYNFVKYRRAIEDKNKLPIITVKTGYTGGWVFTFGHTN